jgi:hypothetical protein
MSNLDLLLEHIRRNPPYSPRFDPRCEVTLDSGRPKPRVYPKNGHTGPPVDNRDEYAINFAKVERVGSNGWGWLDLVSVWFAWDIDAIKVAGEDGHERGLTAEEIEDLIAKLKTLGYVFINRSKSGKGFHVFVLVSNAPAKNRQEHYRNRKRVELKISADLGINFAEKKDKQQAGVVWLWAKETGKNAFEILKGKATILDVAECPEVPEPKKGPKPKELKTADLVDFDAIEWLEYKETLQGGTKLYRTKARCPFHDDGDGGWGVWVNEFGTVTGPVSNLVSASREAVALTALF